MINEKMNNSAKIVEGLKLLEGFEGFNIFVSVASLLVSARRPHPSYISVYVKLSKSENQKISKEMRNLGWQKRRNNRPDPGGYSFRFWIS